MESECSEMKRLLLAAALSLCAAMPAAPLTLDDFTAVHKARVTHEGGNRLRLDLHPVRHR